MIFALIISPPVYFPPYARRFRYMPHHPPRLMLRYIDSVAADVADTMLDAAAAVEWLMSVCHYTTYDIYAVCLRFSLR